MKAVPHSQSHGHHSVKASVTLPGLLRQNPKMNMDKGALVRAVGTGSKQPAIHRFPFENQPMTIRTTAAITVVGDIPVCTRACHGVAEAGENAGRSAGTNAGTNAEKASEKASVSLKKLLGEHASLPFNPLLANAFFRAGEIEAWGRGIHRIFQACREAATPAPQIRYETNELWLEFAFSPDYLSAVGGGAGQKPERGEKWGDKWGDKWGEKALTTRLRIARAMRRSPRITTAGLAVELGMSSTSGIEKHLRAMREGGCIRRVGAAKGGYWEVIS